MIKLSIILKLSSTTKCKRQTVIFAVTFYLGLIIGARGTDLPTLPSLFFFTFYLHIFFLNKISLFL